MVTAEQIAAFERRYPLGGPRPVRAALGVSATAYGLAVLAALDDGSLERADPVLAHRLTRMMEARKEARSMKGLR